MYSIEKYINIKSIINLLHNICNITGIPIAIFDADGRKIYDTGWEELCFNFNHKIDEMKEICIKDTKFTYDQIKKRKYRVFTCHNGLSYLSVPIFINGELVASIYMGQFFLDTPDIEYFKSIAKKYNFNIEEYIGAVKDIPVIGKKRLKIIFHFF